jgi:DNA-binding transcriptional LysR family regulator
VIPDDLLHHDCIRYTRLSTRDEWRFRDGKGGERSVPVSGRFASDDAAAIRQAVLAGVGLSVIPDFMVADVLAEGRLRAVLADWLPAGFGVWALHPHHRQVPLKVRAFLDVLTDRLRSWPSATEARAS